MRILGVGDNTVDTYIHRREKFPGGNAVNVPVLALRYGAEAAAYLGYLGDDQNGALVLDSLKREGLDVSRCTVLPGVPNGFSTVQVIDGDRVFGKSTAGACEFIQLSDEDLKYIASFDLVHTSVYSFLEQQLPRLKEASRLLTFDLSDRCDPDYLRLVLPHTDIAFLSLAKVPAGDRDALMREMIALGPKLVVMTRGKEGSWAFDGDCLYHQDIIPVETVDSLGAGDAFAARFLLEYWRGVGIPTAMERAASSAAENCTYYGAYGYGKPY